MCFADNLFSQVYVGIGAQNKGVNCSIGAMVRDIDFNLSYALPITSNENKKITSLAIGKQFLINDRFTVLPAIGYGRRKWTDYSQYDDKGIMIAMQDFKPIGSLQIGLNGRAGNVYAFTSYCNEIFYGLGMKIYFSKL